MKSLNESNWYIYEKMVQYIVFSFQFSFIIIYFKYKKKMFELEEMFMKPEDIDDEFTSLWDLII